MIAPFVNVAELERLRGKPLALIGEEVDGAHVIGGHPGATLVHAAVAMAQIEEDWATSHPHTTARPAIVTA